MKAPQALLATLLIVASLLAPVASAAGANLAITTDAEPDLITPGIQGYLVLKIRNSGDAAANDIILQVPNAPSVLSMTSASFTLGTLTPGTNGTADLPFTVASSAAPGLYIAHVTYAYNDAGKGGAASGFVDIPFHVQSYHNLILKSVAPDRLAPGVPTDVTFTFQNVGNATITRLVGDWDAADKPLQPAGGSDQFAIDTLPAGATASATTRIAATANAPAGGYALPLNVTYLDESGSPQTSTFDAGILVGGVTSFDVASQGVQDNVLTLAISNTGNNRAGGIALHVGGAHNLTTFLGSLGPGEFTVASFPWTSASEDAPIDISFTDSTGARQTTHSSVSVAASSTPTDQGVLGLAGIDWVALAIALIVLVVGIVLIARSRRAAAT